MREVLLQLKISPELNDRLRLKTQRLSQVHEEEMDALEEEIKKGGGYKRMQTLQTRYEKLCERGRRLTHYNVIRQALSTGLDEMRDPKDALAGIAKSGVAIGRPRRVAG